MSPHPLLTHNCSSAELQTSMWQCDGLHLPWCWHWSHSWLYKWIIHHRRLLHYHSTLLNASLTSVLDGITWNKTWPMNKGLKVWEGVFFFIPRTLISYLIGNSFSIWGYHWFIWNFISMSSFLIRRIGL